MPAAVLAAALALAAGTYLEDAGAAEAGLVQLALALLLHRDGLEPLLLHLAASGGLAGMQMQLLKTWDDDQDMG